MPAPESLTATSRPDLDLEVTSGEWPTDISGEFVVSGPEVNAEMSHAFFGFGTMSRLSLTPGTNGASAETLAWRTKVIDSPSRRLFEAASDDFALTPVGWFSPYGSPNMSNTAPLPWGDRLLATWDVGRPSEIDPVDLTWRGDIGSVESWGPQSIDLPGGLLPFYFSSAHPIVDPDRDCLWTVKLMPDLARDFAQQVELVQWDGKGPDVTRWVVDGAEIYGSMHSITQTAEWLVLADSGNFKPDPSAMAGGDRTVRIDERAPVFLVRKADLDALPSGGVVGCKVLEMGPPAGHFYGAWDDTDGIRIVFEHMDMLDLGFPLAADDLDRNGRPVNPAVAGLYSMNLAPSTVSELVFHPESGRVEERASFNDADWTWNLQLSAMDWSTEGLASPALHHVAYHGCRPGNISQRAIAHYADRLDLDRIPTEDTPGVLVSLERGSLEEKGRWEFTDTADFISSPTFVPRDPGRGGSRYAGSQPGGGDGYVVLPVQNDSGFRVEVFDAGRVADGPVAVASAPSGEVVPVLLHSGWLHRAVPSGDVPHATLAEEFSAERRARLPDEQSAVAERLAFDGAGA